MASLDRVEGLSAICEGGFDLGSLCIQRIILDGLNLLFFFLFLMILLVAFVRKHSSDGSTQRDWVFVVVSVCCAITSISYFTTCLFGGSGGDSTSRLNWMVSSLRGLIWVSLSVSLYVLRTRYLKALALVWWISIFLFASVINVEVLVSKHIIGLVEVVSWVTNMLLLLCALKLLRQRFSQNARDQSLSKPLLIREGEKNGSELRNSSFFSQLTFSWLNTLLSLGYSKPLSLEDVPSLVSEDESLTAYQSFSHAWDLGRSSVSFNNTKNSSFWALAKVYSKDMIIVGIYAFIRSLCVVLSPLLLYAFVRYSSRLDGSLSEGFTLVGCLVVIKVFESLSQRHCNFKAKRSGMKMRSALMVAIFKKQLKLSSLGRRRHSTGEITNYIAVDAYRLGEFPFWFHSVWTCVLQLFLDLGVLFAIVGVGALPVLAPLIVCGLLNLPFAKMFQIRQSQFMIAQGERLQATSEILNNMKIIKLQSWEEKFKNLIESLRETEVKWLSKNQLIKAHGSVLYWMTPSLISSVVLFGCVLIGNTPLDASTVFTILAILRSMSGPVRMIPDALSMMIQVKISLDRLDAFLLDDELKDEILRKCSFEDLGISIRLQDCVFNWDQEAASPTLKGVALEVTRGQKIAVCGPVGAGKSSLLYAIIGEIPKISGSVEVFGSVAYVSQTSWIQSGTIRDNILYGKPMNKTKYENAIKACALDKDIDSFEHGDLTEIGERGLNMSGGQKQRIQFARAVYNDADLYLLDDPFSAVDAHTASILFNDCVMRALEKKTVVLVTHQVEFLAEADRILVIEGGEVTQSGSYKELLTAGTTFEQLVNAHKNAMTNFDLENNLNFGEYHESQSIHSDRLSESSWPFLTKENSEGEISIKDTPRIQLTEDEEKEIGDVGWKPFYDYILVSEGSLFLGLSTFAQCAFVALQFAATYWLAIGIQIPQIGSWMLIGVYAGISAISTLFAYIRPYYTTLLGLKASKSFFSCFTNSVFKAPMLFFDSTPIGRILTRASSDFYTLDFDIPYAVAFLIAGVIDMVTIICILAAVTWQVFIVAIVAMIAIKYVQAYYLASARELLRINGTTKAPIMNYAAETSFGLVTIRAFSSTDRFFSNYINLIDTDAKLFFHSSAAMEWLVIRVETLQNLTLFTAALLLVLLPQGTIAPEPPAIVDDKRPPASWPSQGRIDLRDLKIRYHPNAPLVLKGITCTFKEGIRVGVVGRTGSGKTTLISALFRLVEPLSGRILIDGLDICSIGLRDLRLKLSIIPQDPTLFRGTVRTNLDPLGLYSDQQIWEAIEKCQLKSTIQSLPNLLDSYVSDEGDNWSMGQRQLFCLGRVLLKRNKILVLDEATASIDSATDAILQRVIRQEFSYCTVVTVAHRVPTVTDSDMVMVLSYVPASGIQINVKLALKPASFPITPLTNAQLAKQVADLTNKVKGYDELPNKFDPPYVRLSGSSSYYRDMAYVRSQGRLSGICEGEFDLGSSCMERVLVDDSEDESLMAYESFSHAWDLLRSNKSSRNTKNLIFWALAEIYSKDMIIVGIYVFIRTLSVVAAPIFLYAFVQYSSRQDGNLSEGFALVGCLVVIKVFESLSQRHCSFNTRRSGMRMRSALMVAIYKKQLKLSSLGRRNHSTGEIVNYIAVDAYRMGEFPFWFHSAWAYALQLFLAVGVLFGIVGFGDLPGLVPLLSVAS
ncbi:hypothetical protein GIB67_040976 [Kingdonia uniflora]|uniref:ABC transporter C family member 8 n=1 Tax=Kingdonia uniflora TaxID=39325 RepID=A0A7J7NCE2_9MAGN|nr:hypothetical protein GIB67_040976 [Kingdonia uniflora]